MAGQRVSVCQDIIYKSAAGYKGGTVMSDKTYDIGKSKKNYYLFHRLCKLWEGGQAEQVAIIKEELMN